MFNANLWKKSLKNEFLTFRKHFWQQEFPESESRGRLRWTPAQNAPQEVSARLQKQRSRPGVNGWHGRDLHREQTQLVPSLHPFPGEISHKVAVFIFQGFVINRHISPSLIRTEKNGTKTLEKHNNRLEQILLYSFYLKLTSRFTVRRFRHGPPYCLKMPAWKKTKFHIFWNVQGCSLRSISF